MSNQPIWEAENRELRAEIERLRECIEELESDLECRRLELAGTVEYYNPDTHVLVRREAWERVIGAAKTASSLNWETCEPCFSDTVIHHGEPCGCPRCDLCCALEEGADDE